MNNFLPKNISNAILAFLIVASLFFAAQTISVIKGYKFIGGGVAPSTTMSFDGTGEISAAPDIANISFSVTNDAKTMAEAQSVVTDKVSKVLAFLKQSNIADADIKTENYSSYPTYEYSQAPCSPTYCPPSKQTLTGYEVSENISVKVRKIDDAGKIVEGLGTIGVSNLNGPDFTIDKQDALQEQARQLAIADAKSKAAVLAKDLGVTLVRIVNFSEEGNNPPMPLAFKAESMTAGAAAPVPQLPPGENKITSNITITYEIR